MFCFHKGLIKTCNYIIALQSTDAHTYSCKTNPSSLGTATWSSLIINLSQQHTALTNLITTVNPTVMRVYIRTNRAHLRTDRDLKHPQDISVCVTRHCETVRPTAASSGLCISETRLEFLQAFLSAGTGTMFLSSNIYPELWAHTNARRQLQLSYLILEIVAVTFVLLLLRIMMALMGHKIAMKKSMFWSLSEVICTSFHVQHMSAKCLY